MSDETKRRGEIQEAFDKFRHESFVERHEALKQLRESSDSDLSRLRAQHADELFRQRQMLEADARDAVRRTRQMFEAEREIWQHVDDERVGQVQAASEMSMKTGELLDRISQLQRQVQKTEAELKSTQVNVDQLRTHLQARDDKILEQKHEFEQVQAELADTAALADNRRKSLTSAEHRISQLASDLDHATSLQYQLEAELSAARCETNDLKALHIAELDQVCFDLNQDFI